MDVFIDNVSTKDKISVDETANLKQHKKFTTELIKIKNEKTNQLQKNDSNHIHINIHGLNQTKQNALIFLIPVILLILFPISGLDISSIFTSEENEVPTSSQGMNTGYFIENLKGDDTSFGAFNVWHAQHHLSFLVPQIATAAGTDR